MTTRVRVITGELPALVLSYPRDAGPVFGADFTEVVQLPPHFEQEFTIGSGCDLLVAENPATFGYAAADDGADVPDLPTIEAFLSEPESEAA